MASNSRIQFKHPVMRPNTKYDENGMALPVPASVILNVSNIDDGSTQVVWNGITITVRKMLGLEELPQFISTVLDTCWVGEYYAKEMVDFVLRCAVIAMYSNVTLPDDSEIRYKILYGTDLYNTVCDAINYDQLESLQKSINMYVNSVL